MVTLDQRKTNSGYDGADEEEDSEVMDWGKQHNHTTLLNQYNRDILEMQSIKEKHKIIKTDEKGENRKVLHLSDIVGTDKGSIQQREVIITFLKMCGLWTDDNGNFVNLLTLIRIHMERFCLYLAQPEQASPS